MGLFGKSTSIAITLIMLVSGVVVEAAETGAPATVNITEHAPQSRILEEEDMPEESGGTPWLWIILGAVAVIAGVAALAGGGSDGGGGSSSDSPTSTGDVAVTW